MTKTDPGVWRILDANLNRASEGLRVAEDYVRMLWNDQHLAGRCKGLRHRLSQIAGHWPATQLVQARDAVHDVGRVTKTADEFVRDNPDAVLCAAWKRTQQALRSLEEFGKVVSPELASHWESLRYEAYTLEKACLAALPARGALESIALCVLIDARPTLSDFVKLAEQLVAAHVPLVQLRVKQLSDRDWLERAITLRQITRGSTTRLIINDRCDIAAAVDADGVHLGQDDMPVSTARGIVGTSWIGVSTHNLDQARQAVLDGADYLGVGPTFPSTTKAFDEWPGLTFLRKVAEEISLPAFAIGGIARAQMPLVLGTGVSRVAVQADIVNAPDPNQAAREFLEILTAGTRGSSPLQR